VGELLVRAPAVLNRESQADFRREALRLVEATTGRRGDAAVGGERLVVDLAGTTRVDSVGLGTLVLVRERASELRRTVCLRGASEELRFLLVLTRMEDRFEFEPVPA
jgi:anti-anti-sigma regulatory factor